MIPTILCITEQGTRIVKSGYSLVVKRENQKILIYPLEQISQLVVLGRIEVSNSLLSYFMQRGIETVFLSQDGRFKGRIIGATSKNIAIRQAQFAIRRQPENTLVFSRRLIGAKIRNTAYALRKISHGVWEELRPRIRNALKSVEQAPTLDILRGLEGSFAALYFSVFPRLLKNKMGFKKRIKHPPTDPVNILLSFGYTLLFNTLYGQVEAAGLDPYAGFFHQTRYGHPALVSDMMEPFRANMVDRLVVRLINNQVIKESDFHKEKNHLKLSGEAVRGYVKAYRHFLFTPWKSGDRKINRWQLMQQDVWQLQKYIQGEKDDYRPFLFR